MAYIDIVSVTTSSIRVILRGLDAEYSKSDRVCTWYLDGVRKGTTTLEAKVSSGGAYTFGKLSPGTEYLIAVEITAPSWDYTVNLDVSVETEAISVEPWSWSHSNGSASDAQTKKAYSAVSNNGYLESFSYLVWNDMVDKVKEILDANGYLWNALYASYSATKMTSNDKSLTAKRFNSLRYNIGSWYPTGIEDVYQEDFVYGSYFIRLTDCMNEWIG